MAKASAGLMTQASALEQLRGALQTPEQHQALSFLQEQLEAYQRAVYELVGPGHKPPATADSRILKVARPSIQAAYWTDGPWQCLRLEERTIGTNRVRAYYSSVLGRSAIRHDEETEGWMRWIGKICEEFQIEHLKGDIRLVFFPGRVYTFWAWREVPHRPKTLLHPQDCDNAAKATIDAISTKRRLTAEEKEEIKLYGAKPRHGAYEDDTQVVDLLVFRFPQVGDPPVNRQVLRRVRKKKAKARKAEKAAIAVTNTLS